LYYSIVQLAVNYYAETKSQKFVGITVANPIHTHPVSNTSNTYRFLTEVELAPSESDESLKEEIFDNLLSLVRGCRPDKR